MTYSCKTCFHRFFTVFVFTIFSILVLAVSPATASCDIAIGTPYLENVDGKTITRVMVSGEALGTGFDVSTSVKIDCNAGNSKPAPPNPSPQASKSTYTSSTLPYKGYCDYPAVDQDTTYSISATLFPHDASCIANGVAEVKIEGSGMTAATPTATISATSSPTVMTPASTPAAAVPASPTTTLSPKLRPTTVPSTPTVLTASSTPASVVPSEEEPALLGIPGSVNQIFRKGWTIIGISAADGKIWDGCSANDRKFRIYFFDAVNQRFRKSVFFGSNPQAYRGLGIAVKTLTACAIAIENPSYLTAQTLKLEKGWNLVSVQTAGVLFSDIFDRLKVRNDCDISSGPWRYDREVGKYVKEKGLQPGLGYWIKTGNSCTISVSQDAPPALPVD